jgi:hypothetical protein
MHGKLIRTVYAGAQTDYFIGNPESSYFSAVYKIPTVFQIQTQPIIYNEAVDWGASLMADIPQYGDLLYSCFAYFRLPDIPRRFVNISGIGEIDIYKDFIYPNSTGHSMIEFVRLWAGEKIIEEHTDVFLEAYDELHSTKQLGDNIIMKKNMTNYPEDPFIVYKLGMDLYIPLRFWFCNNFVSALPLCATRYTQFRIQIGLKRFENFIYEKDMLSRDQAASITDQFIQNVNPLSYMTKKYYDETGREITREQFLVNMRRITNITEGFLLGDFIQVSKEEQLAFTNNMLEYRVPIYKVEKPVVIKYNPSQRLRMRFTNPTSELMWCYTPAVNQFYNNHFNFTRFAVDPVFFQPIHPDSTSKHSAFFDLDYEPLNRCTILYNNLVRVSQDAQFYRICQPFDKCHLVPAENKYVYSYHFGMDGESPYPTGTSNMDLIDNVEFDMEMNAPTKFELVLTKTNELLPYPETYFRAFSRTWNVLTFLGGYASFLFT